MMSASLTSSTILVWSMSVTTGSTWTLELMAPSLRAAASGADKRVRQHGAERPAAAEGDVTVLQSSLSLLADAVEAHLAAVAIQRRFHLRPLLFRRRRGRPAATPGLVPSPWATF